MAGRASAVVVGAAVLLSACSGEPPRDGVEERSVTVSAAPARGDALTRFYDQRLRWRDCRGRFECARLEVPVDYSRPRAGSIRLAVVRLPAEGDARASLVVNPGGPGASGFDYALAAEFIVSGAVRERYDVVGFDPRGVGRSAPVDCVRDERLDELLALDGSPDDPAEERAVAAEWEDFGAGCAKARPLLAANIGTRDVARDLDVLRAVLGDRKLHYLGKSYGTYIGTTYAERFPRKVGRFVLDGQVDPSISGAELAAGQAAGFETAFRAFLADCVRRDSCPLDGDVDAAQAQVSALLDRVDARPLPSGQRGRPVTQALLTTGVAAALYDEGSWSLLRSAFRQALRGRGDTFLDLADFYSDRGPGGRYTTNAIEALYAVNCLDRPEATTLEEFRAAAAALQRTSPVFGAYIAWGGIPCATWPTPPQGEPHPVAARGADPILVVGTTNDPATPYSWSVSTARQLQSGRLLTYVGDGHTAYRRGSACIDRAVDRYLLEGRPPPKGKRCR